MTSNKITKLTRALPLESVSTVCEAGRGPDFDEISSHKYLLSAVMRAPWKCYHFADIHNTYPVSSTTAINVSCAESDLLMLRDDLIFGDRGT